MAALLDVKNLGISFGGLRAVNGFDISIEKEQLYGLIGPNGAGKTTVFNLLTGVYKPDTGKVILDGQDITGKKTSRGGNLSGSSHILVDSQGITEIVGAPRRNVSDGHPALRLHHTGYHLVQSTVPAAADDPVILVRLQPRLFHRVPLALGRVYRYLPARFYHDIHNLREILPDFSLAGAEIEDKQ